MVDQNPNLVSWAAHLRHLVPVTHLVHVGAGQGGSALAYRDWGLERVSLVEADAGLRSDLQRLVQQCHGWSLHTALVGERAGEASFHLASNPNENGVLPVESLHHLWRNLKNREVRALPVTTLGALLSEGPLPNWLLVDCLPALPVLRGAGDMLASVDVVMVRVLQDGAADTVIPGAGLSEVGSFLGRLGYRKLHLEEERHPGVVLALYVRSWAQRLRESEQAWTASRKRLEAELEQLRRERDDSLEVQAVQANVAIERKLQIEKLLADRDQQAKLAHEKQARLDQLNKAQDELTRARDAQIKAKDEQVKLASDRQVQLDKLKAERDQLSKQRDEATQARDAQIKAKDEQGKLASERQGQIDKLKAERDQQARLAAERQAQVDQLSKQRDEAVQARDAQVKAKDEQGKRATELQGQLDKLKAERDQHAMAATEHQGKLDQLGKQHESALQERDAQRQAVAELSSTLAEQGAQVAKLREDVAQQAGQLAEHQAQLIRRDAELAEAFAAATRAGHELTQLADAHRAEVAKLRLDKDQMLMLLESRADELAKLLQQKSELAQANAAQEKARSEVQRLLAEREAQIERLKADGQQQTRMAEERRVHCEQLTKQCEELIQARDTQARAKEEQSRLAAERQAQLDKLKTEKDQAAKLASDRQAQVDQAGKARDEATKSKDAQAKLASDRQGQIDALQRELGEYRKAQILSARSLAWREGDLRELQDRQRVLTDKLQGQSRALAGIAELIEQVLASTPAAPQGHEGGDGLPMGSGDQQP